jgi:hypothetical protein
VFAPYLFDQAYSKNRYKKIFNRAKTESLNFDLDTAIAHEMDHIVLGLSHNSGSTLQTPNTKACSDITNWN